MVKAERLYQGKLYEIFAIIEDDKCYVMEFINQLDEGNQKKIYALLKRSADVGIPRNIEKFRKLVDDIWEFKSHQVRILCTFEKENIILLIHGFIKKKDKTPKEEIERAKRLIKAYWRSKK